MTPSFKSSSLDYQRLYLAAIVFTIVISILHMIALPLIVSTDGRSYIQMSELLFTDRFWSEFNFHRTPLYPLLIRFSSSLVGFSSGAIILVNAICSLLGILILGRIVKVHCGAFSGALTLLLLTCCPTLVGYSHNALTECGSFFVVSLILYLTIELCDAIKIGSGKQRWLTFALALALGVAYYFRQTTLYLIVPAVFSVLVVYLRTEKHIRKLEVCAICGTLFLLPLLMISPWKRLGGDSDFKRVVLSYGILKQGVLPRAPIESGPIVNEKYLGFLSEMQANGIAQLSGLTPEQIREIRPPMEEWLVANAYTIILQNPVRYLRGVVRSFFYFSGLPSQESQIRLWSRYALTNAGTKVTGVHPELTMRLRKQTQPGIVSKMFVMLLPFYEWLVLIGTISTIVIFLRGVFSGSSLFISTGSFVLFYIFIHAVTCMTVDRYVLPVQPLALVSMLIMISMFSRTRPVTSRS